MYFWILCSAVAGYVVYKIISDYFSPIRQIREPPGHFILGHLPEFIKKQDTISMLTKWCEQFKEYGMFRIQPRPQSNFKKLALAPHDFAGNFYRFDSLIVKQLKLIYAMP